MKVLMISSQEHSKMITMNAFACQNFDGYLKSITSENEITSKIFKNNDILIIDDTVFSQYNRVTKALIYNILSENKIPTLLIVDTHMNTKSYVNVNVIDYFKCPLDWQRLILRINVMKEELSNKSMQIKDKTSSDKFIVKSKNEVSLVEYDQIRFFEKDGRKLQIHLKDEVIVVYESIKDLMTKIPINFVRVHNSYVVNANYISKIREVGNRSYHITFSDYDKIAHMSRYRSDVLLKDYYKLNSSSEVNKSEKIN